MGHYDNCYEDEEDRYRRRMISEGKIAVPFRVGQYLHSATGRPVQWIDPEDLKALREFLGNCALCQNNRDAGDGN